jgi:hypothetical protein
MGAQPDLSPAEAPPAPHFADRVRSAVVWRWGSQVTAQIITWTATLIVVRLLSPHDYGLFAMTQAVLTGLNFLNGYAYATSLIQSREVDERRIGQVFGMLLASNGLLAAVQFLIAPFAAAYYGQPIVADMLRVQALVFLATPFIALPSELLAISDGRRWSTSPARRWARAWRWCSPGAGTGSGRWCSRRSRRSMSARSA